MLNISTGTAIHQTYTRGKMEELSHIHTHTGMNKQKKKREQTENKTIKLNG